MDATLSNDKEELVSINSDDFTERDDDNDENAYDNRLCDIRNLAQPPHETADGSAWVSCPYEAMFRLFLLTTHHHTSMESTVPCAAL
ncbi:unnamed protein product [Schistosoma mattheei]|uniref:Uncharacterized protein n=1 Tax=Schistosoma mattheei TaxID=31246 RepID=A0A183NJK4_9TREM|nr:unnamed protein product [Schistosoma mattheei]